MVSHGQVASDTAEFGLTRLIRALAVIMPVGWLTDPDLSQLLAAGYITAASLIVFAALPPAMAAHARLAARQASLASAASPTASWTRRRRACARTAPHAAVLTAVTAVLSALPPHPVILTVLVGDVVEFYLTGSGGSCLEIAWRTEAAG